MEVTVDEPGRSKRDAIKDGPRDPHQLRILVLDLSEPAAAEVDDVPERRVLGHRSPESLPHVDRDADRVFLRHTGEVVTRARALQQ